MDAKATKEFLEEAGDFQLNQLVDMETEKLNEILKELDQLDERYKFVERLEKEDLTEFEIGMIFGFNLGVEKGKIASYKEMLQQAGVNPDDIKMQNINAEE